MAPMNRRQFLRAAAVSAGGVAATGLPSQIWAQTPAPGSSPVRVYLVVIDGLRPDEVALMPTLTELADEGAFWPSGSAEMIAETTPNHVAMLTGVSGERHGMPANATPARLGFSPQLGDHPRYLRADSLFTLVARQAPDAVTASVTSKTYLVGMSRHDRTGDGQADASYVYQPRVIIPESNHEPDYLVMQEALRVSGELDPDFLFVNLGDVDRVGHADITGGITEGGLAAWRTQTLLDTDLMVRLLVEQLRGDGRWEETVFIVASDHGMDWSAPHRIVNLSPAFAEDPLIADEVLAADNGGVGLYQLRMPGEARALERLQRMREIAAATEGVDEALYTRPHPLDGGEQRWVGRVHPDWSLAGERTGDLIVTVAPGWRVTEPDFRSNPIPGNHGHPLTLPVALVISGGWTGIRRRVAPSGEAFRNADIGATAAWLLGLQPPPGGFDGRVLTEAFASRPAPLVQAEANTPMPALRRIAGADRIETAVALSRHAYPDRAETVVVTTAFQFPDALAAAPLAAARRAPLLLSAPDGLPDEVAEEISRLRPTRAYIIGGEVALSEQVADDLRAAGVADIQRLGGESRYDTARLIASEVGAPHGEAYLVSGEDFPDALTAGPVAGAAGRPILLTRRDRLPAPTLAAIRDLEISRVTVAGGAVAISGDVVSSLRDRGLLVERVAGGDRYGTAAAMVERAAREGGFTDVMWVANGESFADALAVGPLVAALSGFLVLANQGPLSSRIRALVEQRALELVETVVVGGTRAVTPETVAEITDVIADQRGVPEAASEAARI